jgi:PAS domain S-box-containing protein
MRILCGNIVILAGVLLFTGILLKLNVFTSVIEGLTPMSSVTAFCFILLGTVILLYSKEKISTNAGIIIKVFSFLTAFCGAFSLIMFTGDNNFSLDYFFPALLRGPSRMAPNTSVLFLIIGISAAFIKSRNAILVNVLQGFLVLSGFWSLVAVLGYMYGISSFYNLSSGNIPMAFNTSITFVIATIGLLFVNTDAGFVNILKGSTGSARFARRLLPIVFILPLLLGFLRILGEKADLYNYSTGIAIFVVGVIASFFVLIIANAYLLRKEEKLSEKYEKELAENERKLRAIIDYSPSAIYLKDIDYKFIMVNKRTELNHGLNEKDFIGKKLSDIFPDLPEAVKLYEDNDKQVIEKKTAMEFEEQAMLNDGAHTYISHKFPLIDANGKVYAVCGISTDITERKNATDKFIAILDSAPDAIVIVGVEGYIELVNKQTEKMFGYKRSELIGNRVEILIPDELRDKHVGHRTEFFKNHSPRPMGSGLELYAKKKNGELFPVEISLSPMQTNEGMFVSAAIRDITLRKKSELKLKELNLELAESNSELESFSYSVSHDLRAPLRHIIGFGEKFKRITENRLSEEEQRLMQKITTSAAKMGMLIDDLLMFSRVGRTGLALSLVDISSIAAEFINENSEIPGNENITWQLGNLPPAYADPFQIKLVIYNLLSNAVKYSAKSAVRNIEIGGYMENNENIYFVKDSGCGFNMEYSSKLFGVFQRLHGEGEYEGTGIGLATVRRIINRHKGRTWANSEPGKGAEFYFALPL